MNNQNIKLEIKLKLLTLFVSLNKFEWGGSRRCSWFIFCLVPLSSFSSSVHVVFGCGRGGCMCQSQFICSWQHIFSRRQLSPHQLRSLVYSAFSVEVTFRIYCHEIEPKGKKLPKKMSGQIFGSNISEHWQCLICSFKSQASFVVSMTNEDGSQWIFLFSQFRFLRLSFSLFMLVVKPASPLSL